MIMNGSNTSFALIKVLVYSSGRGHTHPEMSSLSTTNYTIDEVTTTGTAENIFISMTGRELTPSDLIEILKSWIPIVILILALFVLLVIFLICVYFIRQRKDRNLLLTILQRLNDGCTNTDDSHFKQTKFLHIPSRLSDDDPKYQEISNSLFDNPNTKQHTNPGYDTDCPKSVNAGMAQDDAEVTSLDSNDKYFKLEKSNPNVVV